MYYFNSADLAAIESLSKPFYDVNVNFNFPLSLPNIQRMLYQNPATVVFWSDGTKTVVKCQPGDTYSAETGLATAICKKAYGNKNHFNKVFAKWLPNEV